MTSNTSLSFLNKLVFSFVFLCCSFLLNAQNNITSQKIINEQTNHKFQEFFFKAITNKAINNYEKAIENLNECNLLIPNQKAILFELSKNYLFLNNLPEAIEYGNKALKLDENNLWILEHLVKANVRTYNFKTAITLQEKIASKFPKKKRRLVYLHLQDKNVKEAKRILNELEADKMLNFRLKNLKKRLSEPKKTVVSAKKSTQNSLKETFEKEKSFTALQQLLIDLEAKKNYSDLLRYSEEGLSLFPAQPFVYLMNGKALNQKNNPKKAIISLQNGIDFVIDNAKMKSEFYIEIVIAFEKLGDTKKAREYRKKIK